MLTEYRKANPGTQVGVMNILSFIENKYKGFLQTGLCQHLPLWPGGGGGGAPGGQHRGAPPPPRQDEGECTVQ